MKKLFLMAILATGTLAMSSCSNEDELASSGQVSTLDQNVVAFSTNGQKGLTRSGATVTSLTTFNVWSSTADGNDYIGTLGDGGSGEAFTYDALSEVFKSDVNHYWPSVGTLNFFASNVFTQMDGYHSDQTPHDAVVEYTNDGSKDIVCATVRTGTKTIPYPLLFHHVLSQVKVTAEAKDKTQDLQYRVVGITMTTQDDGKYHYATSTAGIGTWELNDESSTRAYAFGANMPSVFEKDGRFASTDYWNVLPCVNDLVFSIQYQVIQNGVVISDFTGANAKTVTVSSPGLLSEKKYTYNFKLGIDNDDVITFTSTVSDWEDTDPVDLDVPEAEANNIITYTASSKLGEVTSSAYEEDAGLHTYSFNTSITSHTFENGVGTIVFADDVTTVGEYAFAYNNNISLTSVTLPSTVTTVGEYAFAYTTTLTSVNIPEGVTSIGNSAFEETNISNIILPSSLKTIGSSAFAYNPLSSIIIPEGVTSIGEGAFNSCTNLSTVELPSSLTSIGRLIFTDCTSLQSVIVRATVPPVVSGTNFMGFKNNAAGRKIYVPSASVEAYKAATGWSDYAVDIEAIP